MGTGERCPQCDRDSCLRWRETQNPSLINPAIGGVLDCFAHRVDWRSRCLAAEQEAAALRQERDEARQDLAWQKGNVAAERALLTESEADLKEARAALADRDQQLAAAKEEIARLKQDRAVIENLWSTTNA